VKSGLKPDTHVRRKSGSVGAQLAKESDRRVWPQAKQPSRESPPLAVAIARSRVTSVSSAVASRLFFALTSTPCAARNSMTES